MHSMDAGDRKKASKAGSDGGEEETAKKRLQGGIEKSEGRQSRRNMKQTCDLIARCCIVNGSSPLQRRSTRHDSPARIRPFYLHALSRALPFISSGKYTAVAMEQQRRLLTGIHYYCICIPLIAYLNSRGIRTVLDIAGKPMEVSIRDANMERSLTERMATPFNSTIFKEENIGEK